MLSGLRITTVYTPFANVVSQVPAASSLLVLLSAQIDILSAKETAMSATNAFAPPRLTLWAQTASDLMMTNPMSINQDATMPEVIAMLTDHGFTAAPVIDDAGRPVGVVSRGDILVHDRAKANTGTSAAPREPDTTRVRDIMTPAIFSVSPDTAAARVIEEMLALKVHRLFVVDGDGTLVGVITPLDVLRHLRV
jgi:CBS domain-containing protein